MGNEPLTDTFCKLRDKLHSIAGRLLKDEMEAEDAVQDAFCNLWAAAPASSADEARYRMVAVLRNVCLNKLRRKRPQSGIELPEIAVESTADVEAQGLREELLRHLTPMQKAVFELSLDEEMEYEEIAERLGLSIEATRMHMCRARKILREQYKKLER